jgi:hypothetical protein
MAIEQEGRSIVSLCGEMSHDQCHLAFTLRLSSTRIGCGEYESSRCSVHTEQHNKERAVTVLELDWRGEGKGLLIVDSVQMMTPGPSQ